MSDQAQALLFIAFAALLVVPAGLLARWLELRAAERRAEHTHAE